MDHNTATASQVKRTWSAQVISMHAPQPDSGSCATIALVDLIDAMAESGYGSPIGPKPQLPPVPTLYEACNRA